MNDEINKRKTSYSAKTNSKLKFVENVGPGWEPFMEACRKYNFNRKVLSWLIRTNVIKAVIIKDKRDKIQINIDQIKRCNIDVYNKKKYYRSARRGFVKTHVCPQCKNEKPVTKKYWLDDSENGTTFYHINNCRECVEKNIKYLSTQPVKEHSKWE